MSIATSLSRPAEHVSLAAWRPALLGLVTGATLGELVLLRFVLRMGPMLRGEERFAALFLRIQGLGVVALNLAVLLGTLLLALLAVRWLRRPQGMAVVAGVAGIVAAVTILAVALVGGATVGTPWVAGVAVVTMLAAWIAALSRRQARPLPTLMLMAYAVLALSYVSQAGTLFGWSPPQAGWTFFLGESLAVVAALAAVPAERPGWHRRSAATTVLVVMLFTGLAAFQHPIAAAVTMWNFSFSLFLPLPVYALALASYCFTVLALWSRGGIRQQRALALLLVAFGGLKLDFSYYQLLSLVGFLALLQTYEDEPLEQVPSERTAVMSTAE